VEPGVDDIAYTDDGHGRPREAHRLHALLQLVAIACDTAAGGAQTATITGVPTDATPRARRCSWHAGFKRIILNLKNPVKSGPGASRLRPLKIWFSKAGYLTIDGRRGSDGTLVPTASPTIPAPWASSRRTDRPAGQLQRRGQRRFHDAVADSGDATPVTYYFRGV
jgi:hypothetical protein